MRLSRPGIGFSLLFHALALYGLMHWAWHAPRPLPPQTAIVWFAPQELVPVSHELARAPQQAQEQRSAVEPTVEPEDTPRAGSPAPPPERALHPNRTRRPKPAIAPAPPLPAQPPAAAPTVPAQDLVEARRRAAGDVVEGATRADAHRSFEFPGTIAQQRALDESERVRRREQGLGPPLTVFDSPAKGRAGLTEEMPRGVGVVWVSDDCYVFREPMDRFVLPPALFIEPTTCTRRRARTDLFATAKPYYLMGDEERKAVAAETQRREILRRPTTGAVMSPTKD
jgi:hypothetical protein